MRGVSASVQRRVANDDLPPARGVLFPEQRLLLLDAFDRVLECAVDGDRVQVAQVRGNDGRVALADWDGGSEEGVHRVEEHEPDHGGRSGVDDVWD